MAYNSDLNINNNDIYIGSNGDFIIAESDEQHILDNLAAFPGWWKENPLDGVGISAYQNGTGIEQLLARKIDIELGSDSYQTTGSIVSFNTAGQLIIDPRATKI